MKSKDVLITGATGFIGANLVRYFVNKGAVVSVFTRPTSNKWRIRKYLKDISEYSVDLFNEDAVNKAITRIKPKFILHTATYGGYPFQSCSHKILETNMIGTVNLLNACRKIDFELFVNTGSSSEYGIKHKKMEETDVLEPVSDYGFTKASAALFCRSIALREKRPIVTLRLFSPYGYFEEKLRLIPLLITACLRKEDPKIVSMHSVRDFVFIEDVMDAYVKTIEKKNNISGEIFNIGSGKQYSVREVALKIVKLVRCEVNLQNENIPNPRIEPKMWQADIAKANKVLNWQPNHNLVLGLQKTVNWFRDNIKLYN